MTNFETLFGYPRKNTELTSVKSIINDNFMDYTDNDWNTKLEECISLYEGRKFFEALKAIDKCLLIRKDHVLSHILKGNIEEYLMFYPNAYKTYRKVLELDLLIRLNWLF